MEAFRIKTIFLEILGDPKSQAIGQPPANSKKVNLETFTNKKGERRCWNLINSERSKMKRNALLLDARPSGQEAQED